MKITIAENAGFCFGVKRATDRLEAAIAASSAGERIFTLGMLIHNDTYNRMLAERGVRVTDMEEILRIAPTASAESPVTVFVRAHGIPREDEEKLARMAAENPCFRYEEDPQYCPGAQQPRLLFRPLRLRETSGVRGHPQLL